ncbi:hypothetical protein [Catellatospora tritici]|uniref:hypothetical protein n=1 Tax=Catellatospora tritici TaxID=2851566 RepID=UPI001C2CD1F8|nr:hypothetical protein [Catellatospora tritici]MBV1856678.1 hypothetical protein [Catellatospora tritici]
MERITAKFMHGSAELLREIEVDSAEDPPQTFSLWVPDETGAGGEPWEAVYVRESNSRGEPRWVYRFDGLVDPEM